ncbi:MAG: imidazole glycerol phosphate synthase subunit HisH [Alphaproteobacteria bacterium]|nr:imidazole glycerol phosphate synthase subunit HisH [Alphaproteobacteria bacterium]
MSTVAIVDYGSGNLRSAAKAFERVVAERGSGEQVLVTAKAEDVAKADRIVLPGVGAFADCRAGVLALDGMMQALEDGVRRKGRPFLGICVGMQLMATIGRENGEHVGFGWIAGAVEKLRPADPALKIPHIGWNRLDIARPHALFAGLGERPFAYFVHSYAIAGVAESETAATSDHGGRFTAAVARDNLFGTQFHPEKSQAFGLGLIGNFLAWSP